MQHRNGGLIGLYTIYSPGKVSELENLSTHFYVQRIPQFISSRLHLKGELTLSVFQQM